MREILFKAKRKKNGEWVEGQYAYLLNPHTENGEPVKHLICNGTNVFNDEIDPETLCQYTGLKDKNGKRIWENDIVYIRNSGLSGYGTVEYKNGCLVVKDVKRGRTYSLFGEWQLRVDGNKFDNPELLKPNTLTES